MTSPELAASASNTNNLAKAVALALETKPTPVVTRYDLGVLLFDIHHQGKYRGSVSPRKRSSLTWGGVSEVIEKLIEESILTPHSSFPVGHVYGVFGRAKSPPEDVACAVDPFSYLSHLGAMEFHGLTDRIPNTVFISTPAPRAWVKFARDRMKSDLGDSAITYLDSGLPSLTAIPFRSISGHPVNVFRSSHLGAFRTIKDRTLRVSTIGRTFLDMVRAPHLCGKMGHVLDVYQQHAKRYLDLIVDEVEAHGAPIDKVRIGYILEERCGLSEPRIEKWLSAVQRGGSRKLDPTEEYSSRYSERWCLSLNVPMGDER